MRSRRTDGRPTIADVARLAGVGAITVSRALRDPSLVSASLRESIDNAVRQLNYIPNLSARALASIRTDVIGVLVPSLTQNIFSDVLRGIYDGVEGTELHVQIGNTRYYQEEEERLIAQMLRQKPAGMIISGVDQNEASRLMLKEAGCPVIQIMDLSDDPIDTIIGFSHYQAGRAITEHLLESGYRNIGFVAGWMNGRSLSRLSGLRDVLTEAGLFNPRLITPVDTAHQPRGGAGSEARRFVTPLTARRLLADMIEAEPEIDAVFCNNDVMALASLFECMQQGRRVPQDMGIAGFNDFEVMEAAYPAITSVHTPRWESGYEAVTRLRRRLDGDNSGEKIVDLGFEVVMRESTDRNNQLPRSGFRTSNSPEST
ncbi:LacI family DNA-binding transcriptional regulator (plasmid) [Rhizobium johnstonii]|nr:LacI family DNA-binding transcriptional regulator [Rhizobium johnstonii]